MRPTPKNTEYIITIRHPKTKRRNKHRLYIQLRETAHDLARRTAQLRSKTLLCRFDIIHQFLAVRLIADEFMLRIGGCEIYFK